MSQPARPTRVKRNAVFAPGVPRRRSAKSAIIAPAPTQTPSTAATTGCGQARIALTRSPVMRVKASSPFMSRVSSGPMISCTSPPEEKLPPFDAKTTALMSSAEASARNVSRKLGVRLEGQRVLPLGPRQRDDGDGAVDAPVEVDGAEIAHRHTFVGWCVGAAAHPVELIAAGQVGFRPGLAAIAELRRRMQRPVRIGQVRPREAAEVGATRHQNRVHVVGLVDVADRHRRNAGLVANPIGERRLEHAAVDRPRAHRGLPGGDVDDVDTGVAEQARNLDRFFRRHCLRRRPSRWPRCEPRSAARRARRPARRDRPRAESASGSRASRRRRRCGGWSAA